MQRQPCPPCTGSCRQGRDCDAYKPRTNSHLWLVICAAILAAVLLVATPPASAATIGLHISTAHFGGHGLHASTPGIYFVSDDGITLGAYRNSQGGRSAYAGLTLHTADDRFAITLGAVTGYTAQRVMPLLVPSARIPITHCVSARLSFIPKPLKSGSAAGLHLSIERSF